MRILSIIIGICFTKSAFAQNEKEPVRINQLFNFDWKFKAGETPDAQNPNSNDNDWRKLDLPHDFQFEQPWDKSASRGRGYKAMGIGWYRKTFKADPGWKGKQISLDFEGIMLSGEVWVNGKEIGGTDYGYLGFESDIAKFIKYDADNVVAVRASTGEPEDSRWYTGGGLFRDVHLVVKDKVSIARHGVFITTPSISDKNAEVSIQVEVDGIKNGQLELEIRAKIFSPDGKQVAETTTFLFMGDRWAHPRQNSAATYLWQPLQFDAAGKLSLPEFHPSWKPDLKTGRWSPVAPEGKVIEIDQVKKSEGWQPHTDADGLSDLRSDVRGSSLTIPFSGSQIGLYGVARPEGGFGQVQIKDAKGEVVLTTVIETYCLYPEASLKFLSPKLKPGDYTLTVTVLSERFHWQAKRATYGSSGNYVSVQKTLLVD